MKNMKKVWKYIFLVILLLIGLCAIGLLFLFFVPSSSIFGITYISYNETYYSTKYSPTDISSLSEISVNSRSYTVKVVKASSNYLSLRVYCNSIGYVLEKNSEVSISSTYDSGSLTFDITEPYGLTSTGSSYVELLVPESISVKLNLTNKSADTTIDTTNITISDLYYSTESGDLDIKNCTITGTLDLDLYAGDCDIYKDVTLNETTANSVNLALSSGSFDSSANATTLGTVTVSANTRGVIKINACTNFNENVSTAGGRVEITTLDTGDIKTSDSNIYITTVSNGLTIVLTGSGKVNITNANCGCSITTNTGDISITNATYSLVLETGDGNIVVSNAIRRVTATTSDGNISVYFQDYLDAEQQTTYSYSTDNYYRAFVASTSRGKIVATGVDNASVNISDKGTLSLYMHDVLGSSSVVGNSGAVKVVVADTAVFNLTTKTSSGSASILVSQSNEITSKECSLVVDKDSTLSGGTTSNALSITTASGALTVRDESFANY